MSNKCRGCPLENSGYPKDETFRAAYRYKPDSIKILFIAESPPARRENGEYRYFYFDELTRCDALYREMMKTIFGEEFDSKRPKPYFLKKFQENGFFLVDAAKCPVNTLNEKKRGRLRLDNALKVISWTRSPN